MKNDWERMWDEVVAAQFEEHAAICHDGLAKAGNLCPDSQGPG